MSVYETILRMLTEQDATYSWLLPDDTILPVSVGRTHRDVVQAWYADNVRGPGPGGSSVDWALGQGWLRLTGTGFTTAKLTPAVFRRVQNVFATQGPSAVRMSSMSFYIEVKKNLEGGVTGWEAYEVPYDAFLDMRGPGELRRWRLESQGGT